MGTEEQICGKCGSKMSEGVSVYRVNANHYPVLWVDGKPDRRSFLGFSGQNLDVSGREMLEMTSYRCTGCGLVESYAEQGDKAN